MQLTDTTNIGDAFAVMPIMWGLGNAIGYDFRSGIIS